MPIDNEYNRMIAKKIRKANEEYIKRNEITGAGLSGGFIEHLANALYQHHINKFVGDGSSGGGSSGGGYSGGAGFGEGYDGSSGEEFAEGAKGGSYDPFKGQKRTPPPIRAIGGVKGKHAYKKTSKSKLSDDEAKVEMERIEGAGWSDFANGFMNVVKPLASVAKNVLRVIPDPRAQMAGEALDALGMGVKKKRGRPAKLITKADMPSSSMAGMGRSGGGQSGGGQSGGGRSVRAGIVKDIMKKRGVSMIEASKIVKAEGLYKAK